MKAISKILGVVIVVALICGAGLGTYFGFKLLVRTFGSPSFHVDPVIAMGWTVILLAALIVASSIRRTGQLQGANQIRKEKSEAYQVFVNLWTAVLHNESGAEQRNHSAKAEELEALDGLLALYGSPGVLRAHALLRELKRNNGGQDQHVRSQFAATLLEIRKDLGLESHGLTAKDLLQLLSRESVSTSNPSRVEIRQDTQPRVSLAPN